MSYHNVQNDEDGIRAANQALDDVRALLRRRTGMSSIGAADDMDYALRFQLENMEDMLREITDARFARTLAEGQDVVARGNENVEILLFIVTTARDMLSTNNISLAGRSDGQKAQPQVPALSVRDSNFHCFRLICSSGQTYKPLALVPPLILRGMEKYGV
jgi:hypothetical protein